jgi:alanine racemase
VPRDRDPDLYLLWQFERFEKLAASLRREGVPIPVVIAASSDVLAVTSTMTLDGVDVGKWLYGLMPRASELGLRSAFVSLSSRITHIKDVHRTEYLDSAPVPLRPGLRIGIVPMGIADGLAGLGCREALVRGRRVEVLGSPSIEHCRLDLTGVDDAGVGDDVVFVGAQGGQAIGLPDLPVSEGGGATWRAAIEVRDTVRRVYVQ